MVPETVPGPRQGSESFNCFAGNFDGPDWNLFHRQLERWHAIPERSVYLWHLCRKYRLDHPALVRFYLGARQGFFSSEFARPLSIVCVDWMVCVSVSWRATIECRSWVSRPAEAGLFFGSQPPGTRLRRVLRALGPCQAISTRPWRGWISDNFSGFASTPFFHALLQSFLQSFRN
jgi:hypothetical protein